MKLTSLALGAMAAIAGTFAGDVSAATVTRDYLSHGTASCQAALPVFDGNIRKRPMALGNEGSGTAFVTCDTDSINNQGSGHSGVGIYFTNRAAAAGVAINCTLVDGAFTAWGSFPKTSDPIPAGATAAIVWSAAADNGGDNFGAPALSCALPAGVDISLVQFVYPEEIGAPAP